MAAKEKTSSRLVAWLAPLLLLLAAVAAAVPAPASMAGALETRAWEKTSSPLESRPLESLQLLNLHQQNGHAGYNDALGSPLAAENGMGASGKQLSLFPEEPAAGGGTAQVVKNKAAGDAFRDQLAEGLRKEGRDVATEVYKKTPFGKRFIDIEVSKDGKLLGGVETKVGSSRYTPLQQLKDAYLRIVHDYQVTVARDR